MNEILEHLVRHWSFLWGAARFRIVDSDVSGSFGDAYLVVSSAALRLRFVRDRGQLFLDLQPASARRTAEWYSVDLVYRMLTGRRMRSAELNEEYVTFVREHLPDLQSRFADEESFKGTNAELQRLKKLRAKEMFG